jgi:hypothetical protein
MKLNENLKCCKPFINNINVLQKNTLSLICSTVQVQPWQTVNFQIKKRQIKTFLLAKSLFVLRTRKRHEMNTGFTVNPKDWSNDMTAQTKHRRKQSGFLTTSKKIRINSLNNLNTGFRKRNRN